MPARPIPFMTQHVEFSTQSKIWRNLSRVVPRLAICALFAIGEFATAAIAQERVLDAISAQEEADALALKQITPELRRRLETVAHPEVRPFILNGNPVPIRTQRRMGLVTVNNCSGMLLNNRWAITAGHCFNVGLPRSATVTLAGQPRSSSHVYIFGGEALPAGGNEARGPDIALVRVTTPFTEPYSVVPLRVRNAIYPDGVGGLSDATVMVFGQGADRLPPTSGPATWRVGLMQINLFSTASRAPLLTARPIMNPGQVCAFGDSGGPIMIDVPGRGQEIVAIVQTGDQVCPTPPCTPANTTEIRDCQGPKVSDMWWTIETIIGTTWNVAATVEVFDIVGTEWGDMKQLNRVVYEGDADVDQQPWAPSARSANQMCYNRGYVSGHFNGHQLKDDSLYGLACAAAGAVWRDAAVMEIAELPWRFTDINMVSWAQAGRAASDLCANDNRGYAGGHFNGNEAAGRFGLVCYGGNVQWFDATTAELAATGWPVTNTDTTPWAHAARAGHEFCRGRSFRTGFMNGHQANGKFGVVCQGPI